MAVNQTIAKFIDKASSEDFARDNLFRVISLNCRELTLSESDLLYCQGGKIPSRGTPTHQVQYMGMKMNYGGSTIEYEGSNDYSLTFYLSADSSLARTFEEATRIAFNDTTSTGAWQFPGIDSTLSVAVLDKQLEPIEYIKFYGVRVAKFDSIEFKTAQGQGEALTITLHISYHYYRRGGSDVVYAGE